MCVTGVVRMGLAILLASLLSACWMSEKPLITARNATEVEFAGRFRSADEDRQDLLILTAGNRGYVLDDGEEEIPMRFLKLRDNWYLVQYEGTDAELGSGEAFYIYQAFHVADEKLYIHAPDCGDVEGSFSGMKRDDGSEICSFANLKGLKAAARAYIAKLEKGEISQEPAIWDRVAEPR